MMAAAAAALLHLAPAPALAAQDAAEAAEKGEEDDPSKFFWFHKQGIAPELARTDIEYCAMLAGTIEAKQNPSSGQGGLIGALVEGIMKGVMEGVETRRMRDAGMRKCMGLYGYARYQVPEPDWNLMMRADDRVERLTAYASGSSPTTERLAP